MFSWLESIRSSIKRDKNSDSTGEKRRLPRGEEDESVFSADVIVTPPSKRRRNLEQEEENSIVIDLINRAMSWTHKYNFWKRGHKPLPTGGVYHPHSHSDDDVILVSPVVRARQVDDDVICLDDDRDDNQVIWIDTKPSASKTHHMVPAASTSVHTSITGIKQMAPPLQHNYKAKTFTSFKQTSTPARPPDYTGRPQQAIFKVPETPEHIQCTFYDAAKYKSVQPSMQKVKGKNAGFERSQNSSNQSTMFQNSRHHESFTIGHGDSKARGKVRICQGKPIVKRAVNSYKHKTTAEGVVRLHEKEVYKQLLSQFTDLANTSQPQTTGKENSSFSTKHNTSVFDTANTTVPPRRLHRSPEGSVLSPRSSLLQNNSSPSTVSQGRLTPHVKVSASPMEYHRSHVQDISLYSKPATASTQSTTQPLQSRSPTASVSEDTLLSDWTKKWRDILSPENQERERQTARITMQEEKLKLLKNKRRQEDESAIQEIQERIRKEEEEGDKEEDEAQFTPLSEDMEQMVDAGLAPGNPSDKLSEGFKASVTRGDLVTLSNLNWLNDEVINFYFGMLADRSNTEGYPKVHFFNSFFYPKLVKTGHVSLKRWTRRVDVFAVDIILVPIHLGMHWCLAAVDFRNKTITYYDSLKGSNPQCLDALRKYLKDESMDKKKVPFDMTGWKSSCPKDIPEQLNGCDCGVFTCTYAEHLSRDAKFTFDQLRMPYIRRKMVYEILTKKLL